MTKLFWKTPLLLAAGFFLLLASSCSKEEEEIRPSIEWQLEYVVTTLGEATVEEITYVDENRVEQTIPGQRDFRLRINASSGFISKLEIKGTAVRGGIVAKIDAIALDGSFETLTVTDDDGETSGNPKDVRLSVNLVLP